MLDFASVVNRWRRREAWFGVGRVGGVVDCRVGSLGLSSRPVLGFFASPSCSPSLCLSRSVREEPVYVKMQYRVLAKMLYLSNRCRRVNVKSVADSSYLSASQILDSLALREKYLGCRCCLALGARTPSFLTTRTKNGITLAGLRLRDRIAAYFKQFLTYRRQSRRSLHLA